MQQNSRVSNLKFAIWCLFSFALLCVPSENIAQQTQDRSSAAGQAVAQNTGDQDVQLQDPVLGVISLNLLRQEQKKLEARKGLPQDVFDRILDHYKISATYLNEWKRLDQLTRMELKSIQELPKELANLNHQLQQDWSNGPIEGLDSFKLPKLEQLKGELETEIAKLRTEEKSLASAVARKRLKLDRIRDSIQKLESQGKSRIGDRPPQSDEPALQKAWSIEKELTKKLLEKWTGYQKTAKQLLDREAAGQRFVMSGQLTTKKLAKKRGQLEQVRKRMEIVRGIHAKKQVEDAKEASQSVSPQLAGYAKELQAWADESVELQKKLSRVEEQRDQSAGNLSSLEKRFESIKSKVDAVGLTPSIGKLLRKHRLELKPSSVFFPAGSTLTSEIDEAQFSRFQFEERLSEQKTEADFLQMVSSKNPGASEKLISDARRLWKNRTSVLSTLVENYNKYFDALVDLDTNQHKLENTSQAFGQYIDQRVLWIPSSKPLFQKWDDGRAIWIWNPVKWSLALTAWVADFRANFWVWTLILLVASLLWVRQGIYHKRITLSGEIAKKRHCTEFRPTFNALFHTLLISTLWPVVLFFLGWRLQQFAESVSMLKAYSPEDQLVINSIGAGLQVVAVVLFPLEALRYLCRKDGLGQAHFDWVQPSSLAMKSLIGQLRYFGLPILFLTCALHHSTPQFGNDLAGRICFILGMLILMYVLFRTFSPTKGILRSYYARHSGGWLDRLQYVWFSVAFLFPVALVVLAVSGYYYTAWHLSVRMYYVFLMVLVLLFVQELFARLIRIGGRKSYIEQARLRRQQASDQKGVLDEELAAAMLVDNENWQEEVKQQTQQSNNLLNGIVALTAVFLFWAIWADVVPALRVVLGQALWTTTETISQISGVAGSTDAKVVNSQVLRVITPADLLQTAGVVLLTIILFRNLPGLVDILILNRLPIDQSTHLAITSICSYAVIVVGTIVSAKQLGINWTGVQWLVTALTFGLAFGLQEIFANFVAGIILMFERPIRVGDVVTIGDVTGVVVKTRARATTIRNWDLKELIVPNKEFITGRVLNWTLSDQVSRIVINIGVAYGTSTELVRDRLVAVAKSHSLVLDSPSPMATMESFGDSTLDFVLRAYVGKLGDRLRVTSELHQAIEKDFAENGIEIAFPQLDVNLPMGLPST